MTFLAVVSSQLPPSDVVYPVFFLNSATKINFIRVLPWVVSPLPLVTPLFVADYDILTRLGCFVSLGIRLSARQTQQSPIDLETGSIRHSSKVIAGPGA